MKFLPYSILFCFLLGCCKDDDVLTDDSPSGNTLYEVKDFQPMTVGSYWIYQNFEVHDNGDEIQNNTFDSVYVAGDTIINGNTYAILQHSLFTFWDYVSYVRDSSEYLVNSDGRKLFSISNFTDTLYTLYLYDGHIAYKMDDKDSIVIVPEGTFATYNYKGFFYSDAFGGGVRFFHNFYVAQIGLVKYNAFYSSDWLNPDYDEYRLVRYHIAG